MFKCAMWSASSAIASPRVVGQLLEIHRVIRLVKAFFLAAQRSNAAGELTRKGTFGVPLNIMCSSACDTPVMPDTSSTLPARYHSCDTATGAAVYLDHHFQAIGQRGFLWRIGPDNSCRALSGGQAQHRAQTED